ncbi:MAG: acetylxylan esterase [Clostridia bacterium]|nr:acetylxylan esterase [Clostridia bacterium]
MIEINGDLCYKTLLKNQKKQLSFDESENYNTWKNSIKDKFYELIGMKSVENNACPINVTVEEEIEFDTYKRIRFVFESEVGSFVPCYLLVPKGEKKRPVAITLQGHTTGAHVSLGVIKFERDKRYHDLDFAVQAVENGFCALTIEQRAMGERVTKVHDPCNYRMCAFQAFSAIELGRTLIAERMWDVSKAIDALSTFRDIVDVDKICITGESGGGTMSYYAALYDDRIKFSVPSCSFCSYETSIMAMYHCACNIIPNALRYFEMEDLSCLIAPRPLAIVAGDRDPLFPLKGVEKSFATVEKIYKKAGAEGKCRLIHTDQPHHWDKVYAWKTIKEEAEKLGWEV